METICCTYVRLLYICEKQVMIYVGPPFTYQCNVSLFAQMLRCLLSPGTCQVCLDSCGPYPVPILIPTVLFILFLFSLESEYFMEMNLTSCFSCF